MSSVSAKPRDALPDAPGNAARFLRARWVVPLATALLLIGGVLIFKAVMSAKVHNRLAELRAAGYPVTTIELNVWHREVPWKENAAMKVMEAAAALSTNANNWDRLKWPPPAESLSADFKGKLQRLINENSEALTLLQPAFQLEQSRYTVDWRPGPGALLPHLAKVRALGEMLRIQAALASDDRDSAQAAKSIQQLLKLSRTLLTEPCFVSQQVRIRVADYASECLERALNQCTFTDTQLDALLATFNSTASETQQGLTRAIIGEMSLGTYVFNAQPREMAAIMSDNDEYVLMLGFLKATGFLDRDLLFFLNSTHRSIQASEQPFPQALAISRQLTSDITRRTQHAPDLIISKLLLPFWEKSFEKFAAHEARLRCAETALALQLYRQRHERKSPDHLDQLVPAFFKISPLDPFSGKPLRYRPMPEGFMIYSFGPNEKDDGGLTDTLPGSDEVSGPLTKPKRSNSAAPLDITFTVWH